MFNKPLKYKWCPEVHGLALDKEGDVSCADYLKNGAIAWVENKDFEVCIGPTNDPIYEPLHCEYKNKKAHLEICELCTAEIIYSLLKKGDSNGSQNKTYSNK